MKTNPFFGCTSAGEVQLRFDKLSKVYSDQDEMLQALKAEYSTLMAVLTESKPVEIVKEKVSVEDITKFSRKGSIQRVYASKSSAYGSGYPERHSR